MARTYTTYWSDWLIASTDPHPGRHPVPLRQVWGGWNAHTQYLSSKIAIGDQLFVVSATKGRVHVLAHFTVQHKLETADALARFPELAGSRPHSCGGCVVVGSDGSALQYNRVFPPERLQADLVYETPKGKPRPVKYIEHGLLKRVTSLHGCYRLTDASGDRLRHLFAQVPGSGPLVALQNQLLADPWNREAAQVLADGWGSEPRSEVLRVELAMLGADPGDHRRLVRRHRALVRAHGTALIGQPGGFPFARSWGPPMRWPAAG